MQPLDIETSIYALDIAAIEEKLETSKCGFI
jgi:hypothetical protein